MSSAEVGHCSIRDLRHDPANARRHGERNVAMMVGSLQECGAGRSIVIDEDGTILAGNGIVEAAAKAGIERVQVVEADGQTIVAVRRRGLTPELKQRLALYDNRTAELADWDQDVLKALNDDGALDGLWSAIEMGELLGQDVAPDGGGVDDTESPEPDDQGYTDRAAAAWERFKPLEGELWAAGEHRILIGDSTKLADVDRLMGGDRAAAVVTDPPYAIYGSSSGLAKDITDDAIMRPFFEAALTSARRCLRVFGHAYIHCDWRTWPAIWEVAKVARLRAANLLVWDKGRFGWGSMYGNSYELVGFFVVDPPQKAMGGSRSGHRLVQGRVNVLRHPRASGDLRQHNAAKPESLVAELIEASTEPGNIVVDLFLGSGTTFLVAHRLGRRFRGLEKDRRWVGLALARWADQTGLEPQRLEPAP